MRNKKGFAEVVSFIFMVIGIFLLFNFIILPYIFNSSSIIEFVETKQLNYRVINSKEINVDCHQYKYKVTEIDDNTTNYYYTYKDYQVGDTLVLEFNKVNK